MLPKAVHGALCAGSHFLVIACNHPITRRLIVFVGNMGNSDWLPCVQSRNFRPGLGTSNS